jgi:hypothetical protein
MDRLQQQQLNAEISKWAQLLERIVDVVVFLAKQNLAFRGHREDIDGDVNPGNFLELIKLIGKYDPVMREHLTEIRTAASTTVTYLSPEIQNEFINLLGQNVKKEIISDIKQAKYFSVLFDSTPDISHIDQMTEIIRYVKIQDDTVEVKEVFIDFLEMKNKKAEGIADLIMKKVADDGLELEDCRGQGYDNAATMAGVHSGVQTRIREINPKAEFIACTNHSLNLAGVHAASVCANCVTFFATVERLFTFFSSSTHRWDVLKQFVPKTVKRVVETRWSAKHDAVDAISSHYESLVEAIEQLTEPHENCDTRGDAGVVLTSVSTFQFICYLNLWSKVLSEIDKVQKYLQTKGLGLDQSMTAIESLYRFLDDGRDVLVADALTRAIATCVKHGIPTTRRIKKKKKMDGEEASDVGLTFEDEIKRELTEVVDRLKEEIHRRFDHVQLLYDKFGFLSSTVLLSDDQHNFIEDKIRNLVATYGEIDAVELQLEIARLRRLVAVANSSGTAIKFDETQTMLQLLQWIVQWGYVEMLPNLVVVLRIFLTLCVSVASCERSFSKLKLIKTYLRSRMSQTRLTSLAILSIERDVTERLSFADVIKDFAARKARKIKLA